MLFYVPKISDYLCVYSATQFFPELILFEYFLKDILGLFCYQRDDERMMKASELSLANVGGVFVVLLAGMGLACLIAVFEFIWKSRKMAQDDHVSLTQQQSR